MQNTGLKVIIHELIFIFLFSVEDPSEDFVRLRDFVDTKNCLKSVESFGSLEAVSNGFTGMII